MFNPIPYSLSELRPTHDHNKYIIETPIAFRSTDGSYLSVKSSSEVSGLKMPGKLVCDMEFSIVISNEGRPALYQETQDRGVALRYIPPSLKANIIDIVGEHYKYLVGLKSPDAIFRVMSTSTSDGKLRAKHEFLTSVIESCGFQTTQSGQDPWGRPFWL